MIKLFLIAGETSGDNLGALFIQALHRRPEKLEILGVGGPKMRSLGMECIFETEKLSCMGFTSVLSSLPKLVYSFKKIEKAILNRKPDAVVLIDFPGFNLRLAKSLKKKGFLGKIIQYVSPSVWAWGKKRIAHLEKYCDTLLCIYPFEPEFFSKTNLPVHYIGNPTLDAVKKHIFQTDWKKRHCIPESQNLVALFPGSRAEEIERHLPLQLKIAEEIKEQNKDVAFALSLGHEKTLLSLEGKTSLKVGKDLFLVPKYLSYELMQDADAALAKSGTVALELALFGCPSAVMYATSSLNRFIAKYLIKLDLPYFSMPNILLKKEAVKEFIRTPPLQHEIAKKLLSFLSTDEAKKRFLQHQTDLEDLLKSPVSASERAAEQVFSLLGRL